MPIFRAGQKLVYFAHVPKCAGSAVVTYLEDRFGTLAFHDDRHHFVPEETRWTKSSPQHVDTDALAKLFPADFFDASFAIVRHPVSRMVSAYHFQLEVEKRISQDVSFGEWLRSVEEARQANPFAFDNHIRPMDDIVPSDAYVFTLEQGLDSLVPWLDEVEGKADGPRSLPRVNERGAHAKVKTKKVQPGPEDLKLIGKIYAKDFARFGYDVNQSKPVRKPRPPAPQTGLLTRLKSSLAGGGRRR